MASDSLKDDVKQPDDFERQFEDLDQKVVLVEILAELQQIRLALTDAQEPREGSDSQDTPMYACTLCDPTQEVAGPKREQHATSKHNVPPGEALTFFEEVEG